MPRSAKKQAKYGVARVNTRNATFRIVAFLAAMLATDSGAVPRLSRSRFDGDPPFDGLSCDKEGKHMSESSERYTMSTLHLSCWRFVLRALLRL